MKVSVALAYYNGMTYIEEQLKSILKQLNEKDEIVISIDRALDGSLDLLKQWEKKDSRIFLTQGPAQGVVKNFEHAIEMCSGDIIFLSDQDDIWLPEKVEKVKQAFEDENVMAVLHDAKIVDENLVCQEDSFFEMRHSGTGLLKNWIKNSYIGCCMAFRGCVKKEILPIPDTMYMHDYWIGATCECIGTVKLIEEPLLLYRRHGHNVTEMQHGSLSFMLKKRYYMMREVLKWNKKRKKRKLEHVE